MRERYFKRQIRNKVIYFIFFGEYIFTIVKSCLNVIERVKMKKIDMVKKHNLHFGEVIFNFQNSYLTFIKGVRSGFNLKKII